VTEQISITYCEQESPRLTEEQRLDAAEGEFAWLGELRERLDHMRHMGLPAIEEWIRLGRPYVTLESFSRALVFAPGRKWERFLELHRKHPEVFWKMLELAREAKLKRGRYGIDDIACIMRWHMDDRGATPEDGEPFKVNNNYRAGYARLLALFDPGLQVLFEFRKTGGLR
jgi:hypothetical protein